MSDVARAKKELHLLIVEEEEGVRQLLKLALERDGFSVATAAGGQQGVDYFRANAAAIDLVLLDVRMRGIDGPQTLALIQQLQPQVRACFMTGDTAGSRTEELLGLGALRVFHKPFSSLADLAGTLRELAVAAPPPQSPKKPD
jgi:CheY-like chemotaxis protein